MEEGGAVEGCCVDTRYAFPSVFSTLSYASNFSRLFTNLRPGKHRDLQRLTVPYARLLGVIDDQTRTQAQVQEGEETQDAMVDL